MLSDVIADLLAGDRGYQVIQQLPASAWRALRIIAADIGHATVCFQERGAACAHGPG